ENEKASSADQVFQVTAKNPQKEHVSQQVQPPAMQKHGGEQGNQAQIIRHDAPVADELIHAVAQHELIQEDDDVDRDQRAGDHRARVNTLARAQRDHEVRAKFAPVK